MKPSHALLTLFVFLAVSLVALPVMADSTADLQKQIAEKNVALQALQAEILRYEQQLTTIGAARQTLETEIKRLDASRKKLTAEISVTQNRIATANLSLEELTQEIDDRGQRIIVAEKAIGKSLRTIGALDGVTVAEYFLSHESLTSAWQEADRLHTVQEALSTTIANLGEEREALEINHAAVAKEQRELVLYKKELAGQKSVLDQNRTTQSAVLSETKNTESTYQSILTARKAAAEALQNDINNHEAQLEYSFDPTKLPKSGSGVLSFPIDPAYLLKCPTKQSIYKNIYCITQYFGNTAFALSGAYKGAGHNGIDFGMPEGTKVLAASSGVVQATGNTDLVKGCYSFGKWALVKHDNGLASVYAHLSYSAVSAGERVEGGQFLGLSGKTGYATGPHLHFGLYAGDAVKIVRLGDIRVGSNCKDAIVPIAPTAAYLNPLQYL